MTGTVVSLYWQVNIFAALIPFIFSFHPKLKFIKKWYAYLPAIAIPLILFILWDIYFTSLGVWGFNPEYLSGIELINLPLEEWMFFICIPFACLFTYASVKTILPRNYVPGLIRPLTIIIILVLAAIGVINIQKLYTSITFLTTALMLTVNLIFIKAYYLEKFFTSYLIIFLFPFIIVNGILTGSFFGSVVVWYNDFENLGIRILTIPLEDFIYGMLLFLSNVTIYEYLEKKKQSEK